MKYLRKLQYNADKKDILITHPNPLKEFHLNETVDDLVDQILDVLDNNPDLKFQFLSGTPLYVITEDDWVIYQKFKLKDDSIVEFRDKLTELSDLVYVEGGYYTHYFLEPNAIKAEELFDKYLDGE